MQELSSRQMFCTHCGEGLVDRQGKPAVQVRFTLKQGGTQIFQTNKILTSPKRNLGKIFIYERKLGWTNSYYELWKYRPKQNFDQFWPDQNEMKPSQANSIGLRNETTISKFRTKQNKNYDNLPKRICPQSRNFFAWCENFHNLQLVEINWKENNFYLKCIGAQIISLL